MNNEHQIQSEEQLLNSMFEAATRKTELELEYDRAKSLDELFITASEYVCIAAFKLMSCFRLPKRGTLILRLLKRINRSSYDRYWDQSNRLFSECAISVASKLRYCVNLKGYAYGGDHFIEKMATWAGVQRCNMTKMSSDEIARFKIDITDTLIDFEDNPCADESERFCRITDALGRKPFPVEIAKLVAITDPLVFVEPIHFARNFKRLSSGTTTKDKKSEL